MIGTVTELETDNRCGWRWEFNSQNRMALEPIIPLKALFLGTIVHKVLDIYASTTIACKQFTLNPETKLCKICGLQYRSHLTPMEIYNSFAGEQTTKIIDRYQEQMGILPSSEEMIETQKTLALGRAMFQNYVNYYKKPLPDELEFVSTEQPLVLEVPGTVHCICYYNPNIVCSCQHPHCTVMHSHYQHCFCEYEHPLCSCRQLHKLEATLDGVIRNIQTKHIYLLENKTFTSHPKVKGELEHNHQFMGYVWAATTIGIPCTGIFYNGLWKRATVPDKRTEHDLFMRAYIPFQSYELKSWQEQTVSHLLTMFDPFRQPLIRNRHPVGGCKGVNGCNFDRLCEARFKNINYQTLLKTAYVKRERNSIFAEQTND